MKLCYITRIKNLKGNIVSPSHNKTRRSFSINLHFKRVWSEANNSWSRRKVSSSGLRVLDKFTYRNRSV
ncbi:50S ribosomal protein L28 [Candidatus Tremblaya phenacola]|uniref:Large ribosomal subunit protein bL28 n=1 Tax=Candidatus Tremblayella phenacoccinincola TaxID=1010676 RepID=A0A2G0V756_9PROT|nr:50S ribosomal protein L28 [Candidatus Tremblaya phenacola]PHN16283.1 50S ribosomal protein L28 [Candidatus Tremblaya phenacola]